MNDDELLDIAVHEAGHAVILLVLGFIGGRVTIKPTGNVRGTAEFSCVLIKPRRYYRPNAKSFARALILANFAGPIAALYFRGIPVESYGNGADIKRVNAEAKAAGIEHEVERLAAYACRLVHRHREKIARVATELVGRKSGTMSAYMVHRFTFHSKTEFRRMRRRLLAAQKARTRFSPAGEANRLINQK